MPCGVRLCACAVFIDRFCGASLKGREMAVQTRNLVKSVTVASGDGRFILFFG